MATDGSLDGSRGSFGWILGLAATPFWTCSGPVDGAPPCMSSTRAELTGLLSAVRFLYHYFHLTSSAPSNASHVRISCDSKSAIARVTANPSSPGVSFATQSDYDLVSEVRSTLSSLPFLITFHWIKGHQDSRRPSHTLSPEAQLNICADRLATNFLAQHPPSSDALIGPALLPHTHGALIVAGQGITSHLKAHISKGSLLPALRTYTISRNRWHPAVWDTIDWAAHSTALRRLSASHHTTVVKFLHRWLPTNHNMAKRNASTPTTCPRCPHTDETDDHVCRCPNQEAQDLWDKGMALLSLLLKRLGTDSTIISLLLQGLRLWHFTGSTTHHLMPPASHPYADQLLAATIEQNAIGWDQVLHGRLSRCWGLCQFSWASLIVVPTPARILTGSQWTSQVASWGFSQFLDLWRHRNSAAHASTTAHHTSVTLARLQAQVRDFYSRSTTLPRADQDAYFRENLATFQLSSPFVLEVWVAQVSCIFIQHRKEINQRI